MAQSLFLRSFQSNYRSWVVYCGLVLSVSLTLVQILASANELYPRKEVKLDAVVVVPAQESQQTQQLEVGKQIERELTGGQSHSYQMTLAAGQYVKLVVDQRGIDVVVKLFGPDGKQVTVYDSEIRMQGRERVELTAEDAGSYRTEVLVKYKNAAAGRYQIQVVEVRVATDNDRALHKARNLTTEFARLNRTGKYDEARLLVERVLEIRERVLGPEHLDVARALTDLAILYFRMGDSAKAEPFFQRARAIREKLLESEHPDVAGSLNNLAILYKTRGDYTRAEPLYQRARAIWEKALGPEHLYVIYSLNNLAILYQLKGDFDKAEPLFQRALLILEKTLGPEHPDVAQALNNLADLYRNRGDYVKAELSFQRALNIREKALESEHPDVAQALHNLATLYRDMGDHAKAERFNRRALIIREKVLGPDHHDIANTLRNLAYIYEDSGDYAKGEPLLQRALLILEKALGTEHIEIANALNHLANLYRKRGDYAKAEPRFQRALTISEKSLGPKHPYVAGALNDLALLYAAKGDIARALTFLSRANAANEHNFALNLAIGSERQKLAYLTRFSRETDFTLSFQSQTALNDSQALDLAFTTLLRRKGRGLDAMTDTIATLRRHASLQDQELFDKLADARSQLATLTLKEPDVAQPNIYRKRTEELEGEIDKLEGELSSRSAEFRRQTQPVTIKDVQAALPAGSALVEFAVYSPLDPKTEKRNHQRYLVYLLTTQGPPKWVDLGEAAVIDRAVDAWRKGLRDPNRTDVTRLARALDQKVMRPVRSLLSKMPGDARRLLIAPDGSLNLIPFAALVDERSRYLVERYTISYLTSGRDLLRLQTSEPSKSVPLIMANPLFGIGETAGTRVNQSPANSPAGDLPGNKAPGRNDPREVFFEQLPGTRREALAIKALLPEASLLLRENATEAALKEVHAPSILHIATHGFFLDDQEAPPPDARGLLTNNTLRISDPRLMKWAANIDNPLLRSGLALAGVNQHSGGDDDGLLTALETASLNLWGTKLVVLSACDTGVGKVKNGEGVYGLRRALVLAGSETQVISLWPVLDRETRGMMAGYYRRLMKGEGRGEALRQIQLEMLKGGKLRHPYYWASFIQAGEWANLDGKR
jgi:CHAT domain-containing protein/Tfp pilus assembly protein PilF